MARATLNYILQNYTIYTKNAVIYSMTHEVIAQPCWKAGFVVRVEPNRSY